MNGEMCLYQNMGCITVQFAIASLVGTVMLIVLFYFIPKVMLNKGSRFNSMSSKQFEKKRKAEEARAEEDQRKNPDRYPGKKQ